MMFYLNALATVVGWFVILLWLLGALGLGDFRLYFGPVQDKPAQVMPKGLV